MNMGNTALKLDRDESFYLRRETRESTRAAVYVAIDVMSEHNFWSGLSMNMSEGGVFVATHHHVPVGTRVSLNMMLPGSDEPIVVTAEVRWGRDYTGQEDVPPGIGLQFVDMDDTSLTKIRSFVKTVREPLFYDE